MHNEKLSYKETAREFDIPQGHKTVAKWERIYLEEGKEGLYIERRGRKSTGRPPKLKKKLRKILSQKYSVFERRIHTKKIECFGYREATAREKAQVIWELRHKFKIWLLIDIAKISRSTYYYYSKHFDSPKLDKYFTIKAEIRRIYDESKSRYGYRRITKELKKNFVINHKTVQKLMRKMCIFCRVRMHKYNSYNGDVGKIAPNLLERDFKADKPNQKWVTDVTEFALFGVKLYLSPIIDLYNGEVVSYNLSRHLNLAQTTDMLEKAFAKIPDNTNLILHSDQGWQYQHKHYQKMLKDKGICPVMATVLITLVQKTSSAC